VLQLSGVPHLCSVLRISPRELFGVLRRAEDFYEELVIVDPQGVKKPRTVANPIGELRKLQSRFYRAVLLPGTHRSPHSHGGIVGRSILTNARTHLDGLSLLKVDVSSFYPSVSHLRVRGLFQKLGYDRELAIACTRLCTFDRCLSQGLITSPAIADMLMASVDKAVSEICRSARGMAYSRFVDDLAVSAPFDLNGSGFPRLVGRIIRKTGFGSPN
jgi:RNA-directed DNA polymerase